MNNDVLNEWPLEDWIYLGEAILAAKVWAGPKELADSIFKTVNDEGPLAEPLIVTG